MRFANRRDGVGPLGAAYQLDASTPIDLKNALYEGLLTIANRGARFQRSDAMNQLGIFFLSAFGTCKSLHEVEAKKMVLRIESGTKNTTEQLRADITLKTRTQWMVDCLLEHAKWGYDPRLSPVSLDFGRIDARIWDVLGSIDRLILQEGLRKDVDNNVIRLMWTSSSSEAALRTSQHVHIAAQGSTLLLSVVEKVDEDNAEALDALLAQRNPLVEGFKNRLVTVAADSSRRNVLRTLLSRHGGNPDYIDKVSGRELAPIADAAMRNDYPTMATLIDCGADARRLVQVMDRVVRSGTPATMGVCLHMLRAHGGILDNENLFGGSSLCHQLLDGISPVMSLMWRDIDEMPPDVATPPPLFEAVGLNRLDMIQALLAKGADPNVRCEGITAVHIAVRCLHPTALLLLLTFGASPNPYNSREGYTTPLHSLSECRLVLESPSDSAGHLCKGKDFLLRDYKSPAEGEGEVAHRRSLVIRILLAYGADPKAHCIDGFTPLMTAFVSPEPESNLIFSLLLQAGVSIDDRSSRDETILHICVLARDIRWLQEILSIGGARLINAKDISSCTPLFVAARQEDSSDLLRTLLDHGADINNRGILGLSPLDVALAEGQKDNLSVLLHHAGRLSQSDRIKLLSGTSSRGRSPFHICLANEDTSLASNFLGRLVQLASSTASALLTSRDQFGYTPIDYAHLRDNKSAIRMIVDFVVPKVFGHIHISYMSSQQLREKFPNAESLLKSFKEFNSLLRNRMPLKEDERIRCYDACEYTGGRESLAPVEVGYEECLMEWLQQDGDNSRRVVWCMNNLGTVYERYGRLQKAQDIHYRGWKQALRIFGNRSPIAQDFACKFLRVVRDRGLQETESSDVAMWYTLHGRNTLRNGFEILNEKTFNESKKSPTCNRKECNKASRIVCKGTSPFPFEKGVPIRTDTSS
jgi:ankyrin repeat protein